MQESEHEDEGEQTEGARANAAMDAALEEIDASTEIYSVVRGRLDPIHGGVEILVAIGEAGMTLAIAEQDATFASAWLDLGNERHRVALRSIRDALTQALEIGARGAGP